MKKMINIFLCVMSLLACSFRSNNSVTTKLFVGFIDKAPVFDCNEEKKLYVYRDKLEEAKQYKTDYRVLLVSNSLVCYDQNIKANNTHNLVIVLSDVEQKYPVKGAIVDIATNGVEIAYTNPKDANKIKIITNNTIKDANVNGYVKGLIGHNLYYTIDVPFSDDRDGLNVNLYKINIDNITEKAVKVMSNTIGESTIVLPNEQLIYDEIYYQGGSVPVIYNIAKGKFKTLSVEEKFSNAPPFYSNKKNCLVFYDYETLEMKFVDIPKEFDLKR